MNSFANSFANSLANSFANFIVCVMFVNPIVNFLFYTFFYVFFCFSWGNFLSNSFVFSFANCIMNSFVGLFFCVFFFLNFLWIYLFNSQYTLLWCLLRILFWLFLRIREYIDEFSCVFFFVAKFFIKILLSILWWNSFVTFFMNSSEFFC